MERKTQYNIWYVAVAFAAILLVQYFYAQSQRAAPIAYSTFDRLLDEGKIARIAITDKYITGEFREPQGGQTRFITTRVEPNFAARLEAKNVEYTGVVESTFLRDLLSWVLPVLLFVGIWYFVIRRFGAQQGG